jgi:hypothetical protein
MDYGKIQALLTFGLAVAGVVMALFNPTTLHEKLVWILFFVGVGAVTILVQRKSEAEDKAGSAKTQARLEFLMEVGKPLREVNLVIELKAPLKPADLKHFRAMITISDLNPETQYTNASDKDNPHPTLCVGGMNHYPVATFGGKSTEWYGVQHLVWRLNPDGVIQNTIFSASQTETSQVVLGGELAGKGPFRTIGDLENKSIDLHVTDPLASQMKAVYFIGNDYLLLSGDAIALAAYPAQPSCRWPENLNNEQRSVPWVTLVPKGSDFDRFNKEKVELGHDPDWFPWNLHRQWNLDFSVQTPTKLRKFGN